MAGPFYNNIKGTTAGTPGTGAFTPNAASSGFLAWSTVPTGWIGLVRYDDGAAWELQYSYWNGTTLSRSSTQFVSSSTGSALTLTSSATATLAADGADVSPHMIVPWRGLLPGQGQATTFVVGMAAWTTTGTASGPALAATSFITAEPRNQLASATTANAQCGVSSGEKLAVVSATAGMGGYECTMRFGVTQLPTGPRLFAGMTSATFVAQTIEPSAFTASYAVFGKDSTDTNIQLLVNSNAGAGTKTDTGITWAANGWYEGTIWSDPGSTTVRALLVRLDTGAIWYGSTSTDVPPDASLLVPNLVAGLNGTNTGTALNLQFGGMLVRTGAG